MTTHKSDCAVHNEPAYPNGPCDCGAEVTTGTITWDASEPIRMDYTTTRNPKFAFYPDTPTCTEYTFKTDPTMWARVDKDNKVTFLDMDVCAKGTDPYSALAVAVWNAAIDAALEKCSNGYNAHSIKELKK